MALLLAIALCVISGIILLVYYARLKRTYISKPAAIPYIEIIFMLSLLSSCIFWFNFEFALAIAVLLSGCIAFLDWAWESRRRKPSSFTHSSKHPVDSKTKKSSPETSLLIAYSRDFFWVLFIVLIIRSFAFSPFKIPSGSLEPTLLTGDYIVVSKYSYGLRIPVLNHVMVPIGEPKRGDIVVVHWPANEKLDFIKRVVGVPGDHISYIDKRLYVNGKPAKQTPKASLNYRLSSGKLVAAERRTEDLLGAKHDIYVFTDRPAHDYHDIVVPEGQYFMLGDNRDDSEDSRYWGFVTHDQLVGKAEYVVFSWNSQEKSMRWHRIAKKIG